MAAVDYFLKIDGVVGETTDSKHTGAIAIESFSWGEVQQGSFSSDGGGGAGKVQMQDFHFTTKYSKASTALFLACATGQHIKKAELFCRKAGGKQEEFLKVTLSELLVSSYQSGGSSHADLIPIDQVSIAFAKIELEYKEQKPDGSMGGAVKVGYDLKTNKKV